MKKKNRKNKALLVVALILCITVGYAALSTTLNITGNSEIKNAKWDIHFANLVVDDTSVEATTPATIDSNKTAVNYIVNLVKPGDSYSFAVDVENAGTIDGMISTVTNTGLTADQQKYVEYSITYANGTELKAKDGLKAGAKKNIKVKVKYKDDINAEDLPKANETLNLTFTVEYVQADDTVTPPPIPIMRVYYGRYDPDYHNDTYRNKVTKIVTKTNINVPATAIEQWDVSEAGDGRVVAYIEDDGTGNGTYQVTIGGDGGKVVANENSSDLFNGFSSLKEIDLGSFDTSKVTHMTRMFSDCTSLTSLDLSSFDTSKVTNMYFMFCNCSSLTSLNLSNFDTSEVTIMGYMFEGCKNLTSVDLSNFDTSNATDMSYMFSSCLNLASLNLSGFDTSKVTDMASMFEGCGSLTSLNVSSFNTNKVTNMGSMFSDCSSLTSLNLSNFDTSEVTTMGCMFQNCSSLTSLNISSFNTSNVTNMGSMFKDCSSLTSLDLSNFDTGKLTKMNSMFSGCSKLTTTITIKNGNIKPYDFNAYDNMFKDAATASGAQITVNYTSATSSLVDQMIATKSDTSNVVKGSLVS